MNENKKLWFKRKLYGWGWTPVSWQGWLVLAIYVFIMIGFSYINQTEFPDGNLFIGFVFPFIIFTPILIFICYKKGESPKWQWGKENQYVKVGVGAMIFKDGKILMGKRKNSFGSGEYCFPGGGLEYMESFEGCLRREVLEECGLEIENIKFITLGNVTKYNPLQFVTIGFSADWVNGEPENLEPEKCEGWDWYDLENLPNPIFQHSKLLIESYKTGKNYYDKEN